MGGAGLVVCITVAWFAAPDLALTQLLVEVVTTVLILLGLRWLPKRFAMIDAADYRVASTWFRRGRDLAIAATAGAGLAALAYAVMTRPVSDGSISRFFRSEEHTSELQSLMRLSYAVFRLKKKIPTV